MFFTKKAFKDSISVRLVAMVLLISSAVSIFTTGIQLSVDYSDEMAGIDQTFAMISSSYSESLGQAVWEYHEALVALQVDGILKLPFVAYVEVETGGRKLVQKGAIPPETNVVLRRFDIRTPEKMGNGSLGTLSVYADTTPVWNKIGKKVIVILLAQFLKTILVSSLILLVLRQYLIRHLLQITRYLSCLDVTDRSAPLALKRDKKMDDELELLVSAINTMRSNLATSYRELRLINTELDERVKERSRSLEETNRDLRRAARVAGLVDIASDVLHNVDSVLTKMNQSGRSARSRINSMRLDHLVETARLFEMHQDEIGKIMGKTAFGHDLPKYFTVLVNSMKKHHEEALSELQFLYRQIEHVSGVIKSQQGFVSSTDIIEEANLTAVIEEAVKLNMESLEKHEITVWLNLKNLPLLRLDQHKIVLVLMNLIRNARFAITDCNAERREVKISSDLIDGQVRISVRDTGTGISNENLMKLFKPGFTTRKTGQGFGLYGAALAANAMGGVLRGFSDGLGHGSEFVLEFPAQIAFGDDDQCALEEEILQTEQKAILRLVPS